MTTDQDFLKELDKNLWTAADKLRSNLDAAVYKHAVLGLTFLKYRKRVPNDVRKENTEDTEFGFAPFLCDLCASVFQFSY